MSDTVKAALIIAGAIIISVAAYMYFSPYQQCVRSERAAILNESSSDGIYFSDVEMDQMAAASCSQISN